jgi:hypothetical protein
MSDKKQLFSVRMTPENAEYLNAKGGNYRGRISELINLAVHEMRQAQEWRKEMRKAKRQKGKE